MRPRHLTPAPPIPDDDVTTLKVGYYLIANKHLNAPLIGDLTRKIMSVRRDLIGEQPLLAGIAAPDTGPDAYVAVHPGALAFYNGTQESFIDRYTNVIYLTPIVCSARWHRCSRRRGVFSAFGNSIRPKRC